MSKLLLFSSEQTALTRLVIYESGRASIHALRGGSVTTMPLPSAVQPRHVAVM